MAELSKNNCGYLILTIYFIIVVRYFELNYIEYLLSTTGYTHIQDYLGNLCTYIQK